MTNNQLTYQRNLETERANKAQEEHNRQYLAEINRHNLMGEDISWSNLHELNRHNLVNESQGWSSITETQRHNRAGEQLGWGNLNETIRHNKRNEGVTLFDFFERGRHNRATERFSLKDLSERNRHNRMSEIVSAADTPWAYAFMPEAFEGSTMSKYYQQLDRDIYEATKLENGDSWLDYIDPGAQFFRSLLGIGYNGNESQPKHGIGKDKPRHSTGR